MFPYTQYQLVIFTGWFYGSRPVWEKTLPVSLINNHDNLFDWLFGDLFINM